VPDQNGAWIEDDIAPVAKKQPREEFTEFTAES